MKNSLTSIAVLASMASFACSDDDDAATGSASVLLQAETTITDGVAAGDGDENIQDGWTVSFDSYLITIGDIDLQLSTDDSVEAEAEEMFVVDLVEISEDGEALWEFEELEAGRWEFNYSIGDASEGAERHDSVDEDDFDTMVEDGLTYLMRGTISNDEGVSCPPASLADVGDLEPDSTNDAGDDCYEATEISFNFGVSAETTFGPCEVDGVPGVSVPDGSTGTVAATIHGDHIFFNGFPEGDEGGITRLAQWLADSDLDLDGEVTEDELLQIALGDLSELDDRYQFGGSPIEVEDMWDYVIAQMKTQGHMDGEGECPVDGVEHSHGHAEEEHEDDEHEEDEHEDDEHEEDEHEEDEHEEDDHDHEDAGHSDDDDHEDEEDAGAE